MISPAARTAASKTWAATHFRGVEGLVLPSYMPGFTGIDDSAIRHDVRNGIAQGYFSLFCTPASTTPAEYRQMLSIACDEAGAAIATSVVIGAPSEEANLELLTHAEGAGCTHAMVTVRTAPGTADELIAAYRRLIRSTKLGVVLYAHRSQAVARFDPTGIPLDVFCALADEPNVVAIKLTQTLDPTTALMCAERFAERGLLVGTADLSMLAVLARSIPVQWTGQWLTDAVQSPQHRYVVEYLALLSQQRAREAEELYVRIEPAFRAFAELQRPYLERRAHPWTHMKYYQWCVGGNGGLLRPNQEGTGPIDASARQTIRATYASIGITVPDDDASFDLGRARA